MPTHFTKHRGNGTPSVLNIEWDRSPYSLACPQCGFEYVHVEHVRIAPHGDRSRASAQIAMSCENGCRVTLVIGDHKGEGFACLHDDIGWSKDGPSGFLPNIQMQLPNATLRATTRQ